MGNIELWVIQYFNENTSIQDYTLNAQSVQNIDCIVKA